MLSADILKNTKIGIGFEEATYNSPAHMPTMHYHKHYEILHVNKGSRVLHIGQTSYELNSSNVAVIPPFIPHMTVSGESKSEKRIMIDFYEYYIHDIRKALLVDFLEHFTPPCSVISLKNIDEEFYTYIKKIKKVVKTELDECERQLSLCMLLSFLAANSSHLHSDEVFLNFSDIIRYTEKNFDKKITLDILAKKFYMSKFTISRWFSNYTGTSLPKYLNTIRIINAKKHLEAGKSITETAMLCGFNATTSFDRVFISQVGMSPFEYKKQFSIKNE